MLKLPKKRNKKNIPKSPLLFSTEKHVGYYNIQLQVSGVK